MYTCGGERENEGERESVRMREFNPVITYLNAKQNAEVYLSEDMHTGKGTLRRDKNLE